MNDSQIYFDEADKLNNQNYCQMLNVLSYSEFDRGQLSAAKGFINRLTPRYMSYL